MKNNHKAVSYNKWGYIFLIPFVTVYIVFQLVPLFTTIYNSFFENYMSGLKQIGPNFVGLENYKALFASGDIWKYLRNTLIMWIMGFVPQIFFSLLLGAWFSDHMLRLKGQRFFKTVIYLPNLIMASAFSMLFFALFSDGGPINTDSDIPWDLQRAIQVLFPHLEHKKSGGVHEFPYVVRKYDHPSDGRHARNRQFTF